MSNFDGNITCRCGDAPARYCPCRFNITPNNQIPVVNPSMVKDTVKLEYAAKRESYKREMRQPSQPQLINQSTTNFKSLNDTINDELKLWEKELKLKEQELKLKEQELILREKKINKDNQ